MTKALRSAFNRTVLTVNVVMALLVGAMFAFQFIVALYFQEVLGTSPAHAGLAVLPVALGIGAMSLFVFPRVNAHTALPPALPAIAGGLFLLTRAPVDADYLTDIGPSVVLFAIGGGLGLPSVMTLAMSAAGPADSGLASGLINTSQQIGGALGLAILTTLAVRHADGATDAAARVAGYHVAWGGGAVLVLVALAVLGLSTFRPGTSGGRLLRRTSSSPGGKPCASR
jgi:hypothetical protein